MEAAFLNADLKEMVYVELLEGFMELLKEVYLNVKVPDDYVLLFVKAGYGLVQAPKAWFETFVQILTKCGLTQSKADPCVFYILKLGKLIALVVIYVDDCIIAGRNTVVNQIKLDIKKHVSITELGELK